jgi:hypothetical protein
MRNFLALATLVLVASFSSASAQRGRPFGEPKISSEQWQQYFDAVKAMPNAKTQEGRIQTLITIEEANRNEAYYFTNPSHPAHPAVVKIIVFKDETGQTVARVFGHYAGSKEEFDPWFRWARSQPGQGASN